MERQSSSDIGKARQSEGAAPEGESGATSPEPKDGLVTDSALPFGEEILGALDASEFTDEGNANCRPREDGPSANLDSGKIDYGLLGELVPEIDFGAIPLTPPKRVNAKSAPKAKDAGKDVEVEPSPSRRLNRKAKSASLLDSYFKGL